MRLIDIINPYKWRAYFQGTKAQKEIGYHYCEQVIIRSLLCKPCLDAGQCLHCECKLPDAFMAKDNYCSQYMWTEMIEDPEQWEEYKKKQGFELILKFEVK